MNELQRVGGKLARKLLIDYTLVSTCLGRGIQENNDITLWSIHHLERTQPVGWLGTKLIGLA